MLITTSDFSFKSIETFTLSLAGLGNKFNCAIGLFSFNPVVTCGNGIKFPPAGKATHNPKPAPLLLLAGFKNPEARTTADAPCKLKVESGAL